MATSRTAQKLRHRMELIAYLLHVLDALTALLSQRERGVGSARCDRPRADSAMRREGARGNTDEEGGLGAGRSGTLVLLEGHLGGCACVQLEVGSARVRALRQGGAFLDAQGRVLRRVALLHTQRGPGQSRSGHGRLDPRERAYSDVHQVLPRMNSRCRKKCHL